MLSIMPISFSGIKTLPQTNIKKTQNPISKQDTFTKSKEISFKGKEENSFLTWTRENNFKYEKLDEILTNENLKLGEGFTHSAYEIPENDEFVLRIANYAKNSIKNANWKTAKFTDAQDKDLKINIGQPIGYIEVDTGNIMSTIIEVLKKQNGVPLGNKPSETLIFDDFGTLKAQEVPFEHISRKEHYAKTIEQLANLPQEAYDNLIDTLKTANNLGYEFDYLNSNNFLIDSKNKSINIIDLEKSKVNGLQWDGILYALTNIYYYSTYTSEYGKDVMSEESKNKATQNTITIIQKFLKAMQNKGEKFNKNNLSYEFTIKMANSIPFLMTFRVFDEYQAFKKLQEMNLI